MDHGEQKTFQVEFEPSGRRIPVSEGTSLLSAAQKAGIDLLAVCGGIGICGSCRVRHILGQLSPLRESEREVISEKELADGFRLACQALPLSDVKIEIPAGSLPTGQKMLVEGHEFEHELDPAVTALDIDLRQPTLDDLRDDFTRLVDALNDLGYTGIVQPDLKQLPVFLRQLRTLHWKVRVVLYKDNLSYHVIGILPPDTRLLGAAVDMGSTKLAFYLVDLQSGATLAQTGVMNPQISYGEDVVSRIAYVNQSDDQRKQLQARLVDTFNQTIDEMSRGVGESPQHVMETVIVGNTAMHHFLCGLPVAQLGASPYVPAVSSSLTYPASDIGLSIAPAGRVHMPQNIAGYVGGDHTSALLITSQLSAEFPVVLVDIGTNTEISLVTPAKIYTCSTASGPAFEGAHIRDGMRAAPGAIDRLKIRDGQVEVNTIDSARPVGICGTGILTAVSEMVDAGILDEKGSINKACEGVRVIERKAEFLLVPAAETGHGRDIVVTRKDVNEIQLAKAAIRAGIEILLDSAGVMAEDVKSWVIAGAFGTFLDLGSAVKIGMFPNVPLDRFLQVGNAAGMGAKQMLLSISQRTTAKQVTGKVQYIELTTRKDFTDKYMQAMYLGD